MKLRTIGLLLAMSATVCMAVAPYPGNDCDSGVTGARGLADPYTGNVSFATHDIVVAGAVGQRGLTWARIATSRTSSLEQFFGYGHNWAHNWQWEMVDAGTDGEGRAVLSVRLPGGWVHRFTQVSPGEWCPEPGSGFRMSSLGDAFAIQQLDGGEVRFLRTQTNQGTSYILQELIDSVGNVTHLIWNQGLLVQVTEPAGRWLKIHYDELRAPTLPISAKPYTVITQVASSDGQTVSYKYQFPTDQDYPVLTNVVYPDGTSANYSYAAPRNGVRVLLSKAADPHADRTVRGRVFHYRSESDAAVGQLDYVGLDGTKAVVTAFSAAKFGLRSYAILEDNGATVYRTYNPGGNLAEEVEASGYAKKSQYDAGGRGFKIATIDALGLTTRIQNDADGRVVKTIFPDGSFTSRVRDARGRVLAETDENGHTRRYIRDSKGRVSRIEFPDGSVEKMIYNDLGQMVSLCGKDGAMTSITFDARGLQTASTNPYEASLRFAYDALDRVASITDASGKTTRYVRDAAGRVTRTIYADGATATMAYDDFGRVIRTTDATGASRTYQYDNLGRLLAEIDPAGNRTESIYAAPGSDAPLNRPVMQVSPSGRRTALSYDAEGRLVARSVAAGTSGVATTRFAYDPAGRQIGATNPLGQTVQYYYDKRGRRVETMSALNHTTAITYDAAGHKLSETDAKGNTSRWTYDAMGRELTKTDAKGQTTRREYDAAGRLVTLTDAKLNTYRFEYNLLGLPTSLVYPDGYRETNGYDAAGLKTSFTNRAGSVETFTYDNRKREISSEWSDGSQKIVKAYDAASRMVLEDNGVSKLTFTYDEAGRLASETQDLSPIATGGTSDPEARTVRYTYTADGQRESLGYPDNSSVKFTYNDRGQLQNILGGSVRRVIASYEYDAAGNATLMPRENTTETAREFDAENRTTAITDSTASGRSPLSELDYTYDEAGNPNAAMVSLDDSAHAATQKSIDVYDYDETNQLTAVHYGAPVRGNEVGRSPTTARFTYDAVGNRVQLDEDGTVTRYSVNNLNQYTKVGIFQPTYDRNGNLTSMGQWLYSYDALNRLVSASNGQMMAKFYYDAKNRCVSRSYQAQGSATIAPRSKLVLYTYDNWNLIEERDATGAQQARYVRGTRIDEIIVMVNKYGTFYPHYDAIGNVTMLTGVDGKLAERYAYSVDGTVTIENAHGDQIATSAVGNRWLFTGREWLSEIGLYDYRNRMYSIQLGRFLQTDPVRFSAGDINIYRYCFNRYVSGNDPMGLGFLDDVSSFFSNLTDTLGSYADNSILFVAEMGNEANTVAAVANNDFWSLMTDPNADYGTAVGVGLTFATGGDIWDAGMVISGAIVTAGIQSFGDAFDTVIIDPQIDGYFNMPE